MMTLQGMADHRFTSVSLFTNVFLGEIIYLRPSLPLNAKNCYGLFEVLWRGLAAGCHSKNVTLKCNSFISLQKVYTFLGYSTLIYTSMQFLHTQLILINTVPVEHC